MKFSDEVLERIGIGRRERARYLPGLRQLLPAYEIDTPLRLAHFIAQTAHESSMLRRVVENMNYSAAGLRRVFPKYFTAAAANRYARKPRAIANRAYAGRLGNGDEASGDGFRFRGRGLIQLTGRSNYRAFSDWLGVDVVVVPDLVAERYAVDCAVYYWTKKRLNTIADRDDLTAVTRAVNGGVNGLDERLALLETAKSALGVDVAAHDVPVPTHRVTASMLNIRNAPEVTPSTRIGALPQGTQVRRLDDDGRTPWFRIVADLHGRLIEGYVAGRYLAPIRRARHDAAPVPSPRALVIPPVHLSHADRNVTRTRDGGRAHPLGESRMPRRHANQAKTRARQLLDIVAWLDSSRRSHRRYRAARGKTYCNIYACDYCYLANVFMPRVWWRGPALRQIGDGHRVDVAYGTSVTELNANAVFDWYIDYGAAFGWSVVHDLDTLQAAANNGEVCVIVARNADPNAAGHLSVVVPEHGAMQARRRRDGSVSAPVESYAGARNRTLHVAARRWWIAKKYAAFNFWRHA